jgi:hypothetical protein
MFFILVSIGITSPLLTLWSTTLATPGEDPNQFISLLGGHFGGVFLQDYVALSGSLLLLFAANTAIIGSYHVFLALTRQGFLPKVIDARNRLRSTPHFAILLATLIPVALVFVASFASNSLTLLGDLYAFGLLGAFSLTCLSLDLIRHRERVHAHPSLRSQIIFYLGLFTTAAVVLAWTTNLFTKPLATLFGGGLALFGFGVGLATLRWSSRHNQPVVFPIPYTTQGLIPLSRRLRLPQVDLLVLLPHDPEFANAVIDEAVHAAHGRPTVFVYQSDPKAHLREARLLEIAEPYLHDRTAWEIFARAEIAARGTIPANHRRYLYVAGDLPRTTLGRIWQQLLPHETMLLDGDRSLLPALSIARVRQHYRHGVSILHLYRAHPHTN